MQGLLLLVIAQQDARIQSDPPHSAPFPPALLLSVWPSAGGRLLTLCTAAAQRY